MRAAPRLVPAFVAALLLAAGLVVAGAAPAHASSRHHALAAAARYARGHGYHIGIAVYDTRTGGLAAAGAAHGTFASESVVKVFIAARLLVQGRMHGETARRAYRMITRSDDAIASSFYGSVGGDALINWVKRHYHVPGLGSAPRRAGWWGNTHITAAGLVRLYAKLKADRTVSPWLLNAMHHAKRYGSDGFYQFFGIPSATEHAAVKQGWGTDYDDWGASADENTTGFVNGDRYAVAILARGPVRRYGHRIGTMLTHVARLVLPAGTYPDPTPVITTMSAADGSALGGTVVTLHGTDFTNVRAVRFGAAAGTGLRVVSPHKLVVTTPRHPPRPVYVRVHTTHGHSLESSVARFTYQPVPTVSSVSPDSGAPGGGTVVTVTGSGFTPDSTVTFGGLPATSTSVASPTRLTAVAPAHPPGTVHVRVRTGDGRSVRNPGDAFSYA